jgi:membrane protein YqaA with SNARE-associated domain
MKIFSLLYQRAILWARLPQAPAYLGLLSFAESSFFPIPPDVMLAPMCLANPARAWRFALITTIASVLGGLLGYLIGASVFDWLAPYLKASHYWSNYQLAVHWFSAWGFWAILIAGFSPIPYKVFTIAAGTLSMALLPFTLASLIGRGLRFFMLAALMKFGGKTMEDALHRYVDLIGWASVVLVLFAIILKTQR